MARPKMISSLVLGLIFILGTAGISLVSAQEGYYVYDDFDDGVIDTDLWVFSGPADETNGKIILYTDTRMTALNRNLIGMWFSAIGHQNISPGDQVDISVGTSLPDGSEISAGILYDDNRIENKSVVFCQWRDQYGVFEWADLQPAQWGDTYTFGLEYTSDSSILVWVNGQVMYSFSVPGADILYSQGGTSFWFNAWSVIGDNNVTAEIDWAEAKEHPKLFVVIPGVGFGSVPEHGKKMLERAEFMVRYDDECLKEIREVDNLSDEQVRQMIIEALQKAKEKGKDVVVNIDMDLEGFSLWEYIFWSGRWTESAAWGGRIANIVSEAFRGENPSGFRMLYAHSAGVDAASQSVQQMPGNMMYDDLNLFNGRTGAGTLWEALKASGYGWGQVKVFTSKGDWPAIPLKTLSNYDAARRGAGKAWVHAHSLTFTGHNGLIENIGVPGRFKVNLGPYGRCDVMKTVEEMMLWDWQAGCPLE